MLTTNEAPRDTIGAMPKAEELATAQRAFQSPFVDKALYAERMGGPVSDIGTIVAYLRRPVAERPSLSFFFDPVFYSARYPDVAEAGVDPQIHFLITGLHEGRSPHPLVDLAHLREQAIAAGIEDGAAERWGAEAGLRLIGAKALNPAPYFSSSFYQEQLGEEESGVDHLLLHYLTHGIRMGLKPHPLLDPDWYATEYDDVPTDPYEALRHLVMHGDALGHRPSRDFDGEQYFAYYPDVAGRNVGALEHYLKCGIREGRRIWLARRPKHPDASLPSSVVSTEAVQARYLDFKDRIAQRRRARIEAVEVREPPKLGPQQRAAKALAFKQAKKPKVSILVPAFNEFDYTVECLVALSRLPDKIGYEVIVADDASTDAKMAQLARVPGLRHVRQERNLGFLRNCNAAFRQCRGRYVLLLNNDAQLHPGALDLLAGALDADEGLGAAGPKIVYPNGRLQEAGCCIDGQGVSTMIGLAGRADDPAWAFDRDVDYVSGAALLIRRDLIEGELFDPAFAPAYCEDVDLCLRILRAGKRIRYVANAVCSHHLSVSTSAGGEIRRRLAIHRNQQHLAEKWADFLPELNRLRVFAFYLPQFHPTPANDFWWGKGFTEWTNVAKAAPCYSGHAQPHLPADLGYYDLRLPETFAAQAALARRYGIDGFCVYYYNFGPSRALDEAFESLVRNPDIAFPFFICWANENWTRHWDGGSREILFEQQYDDATLQAIVDDAVRYARDPRYIQVDGKPMLLVYRPMLMPDPGHFAAMARAAFKRAGWPDVHLVYVESMEMVSQGVVPAEIGFDAAVEFPPQQLAVPSTSKPEVLKPGWDGRRYDYPETALSFVDRETVPYPRYPAVFPSWDNTARQPMHGTSFDDASPEVFQAYLEAKIEEARHMLRGDARMVFVNAWNEWAEGAHLEPDQAHGHRWLEAVRTARLAQGCS